MTSSLFWRARSFVSARPRKPWQQQGIHTQTFTFKQVPIYFQEKSPNLVELSFSLPELWAKNLKGGADRDNMSHL